MKNKEYKIKHRAKNLYDKKRISPLRLVSMVAVVVVVAIAGWNLYPTVYNAVMNPREVSTDFESSENSSLPQSSSTSESSTKSDVVSSIPTESGEQSRPAEDPVPTPDASIRGIYLPLDVITDESSFASSLDKAKEAGYNSVIIEAKDANGTVLFTTSNPTALSSSSVSPSAFDATEAAKIITEHGLIPVVKIHAFKDGLAASANKEMAVGYYDTGITWLDNSPELGGRSWLNPYSQEARDYIISLSTELVECGFKTVVIDSIQFPSGVGKEKAGYGASSLKTGKDQALREFIEQANAAISKNGGKFVPYYTANAIITPDKDIYGTNCLSLISNDAAIGIFPTALAPNCMFGEVAIENPTDNYAATIKTVTDYVKSTLKKDANFYVILECNKNDGSSVSADEMKNMISQSLGSGAKGYFLHSPAGKYNN